MSARSRSIGCGVCQTLGLFGLPGALVGAAARERRFRDDAMQQTVALVGSQADAFNEGLACRAPQAARHLVCSFKETEVQITVSQRP